MYDNTGVLSTHINFSQHSRSLSAIKRYRFPFLPHFRTIWTGKKSRQLLSLNKKITLSIPVSLNTWLSVLLSNWGHFLFCGFAYNTTSILKNQIIRCRRTFLSLSFLFYFAFNYLFLPLSFPSLFFFF